MLLRFYSFFNIDLKIIESSDFVGLSCFVFPLINSSHLGPKKETSTNWCEYLEQRNSNTFLFGTSFSGQNLFWKKRGEFWFTNASMDFFDFFFKYGLLGTTIFVLLLTRGLMHSLYKSNVRDNIAILLFFAYSFFGGHVIDSVTSGSLFYYLLATMSSKWKY